MQQQDQLSRPIRIAYVALDPKILDPIVVAVREQFALLGPVEWIAVSDLFDIQQSGLDLCVVDGTQRPSDSLLTWLTKLPRRLEGTPHVWTPVIVLADVPSAQWAPLWRRWVEHNFYVDLISPKHLESFPVRAATLVRIHDHLKELWRYEEELRSLRDRMAEVMAQVKSLAAGEHVEKS